MKQLATIFMCLTAAISLFSVKAEQILSSNDVIAYHTNGQAYLMDVNTGNEIKVKTSTETQMMLWSIDGQHLYRAYYYAEDGAAEGIYRLKLYEIQLPSLQDVLLTEIVIDEPDLSNVRLALGKNDVIYIMKTVKWTNEEKQEKSFETVCGKYAPSYVKYNIQNFDEGNTPDLYVDRLHNKVSMKGFKIENKLVDDKVLGNHYELFAISESEEIAEGKVGVIQLTSYLNIESIRLIKLHQKKLDYVLSPDGNKMLVTYHYYFEDPKSDYAQSYLVSLKPEEITYETVDKELYDEEKGKWMMTKYNELKTQIKLLIGDTAGVTNDSWYEWTKDGRLVYAKEFDMFTEKMKICVNGVLLLEKILKSYKGYDSSYIYYRYKE